MPGHIAKQSIDDVTARTDIVRIVGEYVPLTQRGTDWWGCCPFHNEKTPSFSVSTEKRFYYCFGCHKGGTAITFVMEMEKLSFPEAVEFLAKKQGIELAYDAGRYEAPDDGAARLRDEYTQLYTRVAGTFHYMLTSTEAGQFALDYIKKRGITDETIEKFKLGYSPRDRLWLRKFLASKNYGDQFLDGSGLFTRKNPAAAFFSDRLMFPIFSRNGDVVAMGGRFLRGDADKSPKYLNSGDLPQYKKGSTLYAFNFARQSIREAKRVIFCEGYMDCIAYHQCGITYAVAPLGTALTEEQVHMVKPFASEVLLSFDGDRAGQAATRRAILMCRRQDVAVRVIQLSGGKDPAEIMLNFGAQTLTKEVNSAILDSDFLLSTLLDSYPKASPEGKRAAAAEFFQYLDALQSDVQKDACLEQLCQTFDIDLEAARKDYANPGRRSEMRMAQTNAPQRTEQPASSPVITAALRAVLTAVTDDSAYFQKMRAQVSVDDLDDAQAKKLFIIMEECLRSGSFSVSSILNRCEDDWLRTLIMSTANEYSSAVSDAVDSSIQYLRRTSLEKKRAELVNRIRRLERSASYEDEKSLGELVSQKMEVDAQISLLKKRT